MQPKVKSLTIASGASLSPSFIGDGRLVAIQMPASWTTANLTFQGSMDGSTYADMYDATGTEVNIAAGASQYILIPDLKALWIKVRSGTTGTPVAQGADRALQLLVLKEPVGNI